MKNTIQKFMQDLTFNRLLINAGIEPARVEDIEVKDAEIVRQSNVERFHEWYCDRLKGKYRNVPYMMSQGYRKVLEHSINTKIRNYD